MVRMVLVGQVGRELVGLINAHGPFAVGLSGEDARPVHRGAPARRTSTGSRSTSARSATSTSVDTSAVDRPDRGRPDPGRSPPSRRTPTGCCTTSTPTPPPPRSPSRWSARKLVVLTDVRRPLRRLAGHRPAWSREIDRRRRWRSCCPAWSRAWCRRWRPACGRCAGGVPAAHVVDGRVAHSTLLEVFTSEGFGTMVVAADTGRSVHEHAGAALDAVHDGQLRHAAAGAGPRRGRGRRRRGRPGSTSTCSAASRSTRSATPTRPWWPPSSKQIATLGHVSNLYVAEPPVALAELLLALAGRPGRVFFANSGAEANEAAFKLSRLHRAHPRGRHRRRLPRPDHGRARADRPAGQGRPVPPAARRRRPTCRTATSPRWRRRSPTPPRW